MAIPDEVSLALTGGLAPGAKLRENRFFLLKETGVEFKGQLTYEQWLTGMRMLQMSKSALLLWQADFYREGMRLFGEKVVNDAISQLEFDFMDAQKAIAIAGLPEAVRQEGLTAEHYWVLARASQAGVDPVLWAKLAAEHKLAPTHLHQSIVAGKIVNTDDRSRAIGRGSGIATPHGVRQNFDLWLKQVEKEDPIDRWDRERKKALLDELQPISVVVQRLQAELSAERSEVAIDEATINKAIEIICEKGVASATVLQRALQSGYTRAALILNALEARGIVGPANSTPRREILVDLNRLREEAE